MKYRQTWCKITDRSKHYFKTVLIDIYCSIFIYHFEDFKDLFLAFGKFGKKMFFICLIMGPKVMEKLEVFDIFTEFEIKSI